MAINSISGTPSPPVTMASTAPAQNVAVAKSAPPTQPPKDTVKLSGAALVRSLKMSGMNPSQIAQVSHLDIKTVDKYLGIAAPKTAAAPKAEGTELPGQK